MTRTISGTVVGTARGNTGKLDLEELGAAFNADVDEAEEGQSVELIIEDAEGRLWAWSDDRATQVNFCPFTGRKARIQAAVGSTRPALDGPSRNGFRAAP